MDKITTEEILNSEVRALTWKEPFASAMLTGKVNETRERPTKVRGLVLICSGLQYYKTDALISICQTKQLERLSFAGGNFYYTYRKTRGKAIGIGRLVDCWPMEPKDEDGAFVKCKAGLYVYRFEDAAEIVPFRWHGSQGWTLLKPDQKKLITLV